MSTTINQECDSDSDFSWDNELFKILKSKRGRYKYFTEQLRLKELKICLKAGGCVLAKDTEKNTLLHIAVEKGFSEVVNFLLKENINLLNIKNGNDETVIEVARKLQNNEMCKILEEWGATTKIPTRTTNQPTYHQINRNDTSVCGNYNSGSPTFELPTKADGNCFFHAVFAEKNSNGEYETKLAMEMRKDYHKFLSRYKSLKDENMTNALRDQLKKIFSLFLENPECLTDRSHNIKCTVDKTKAAIKDCETRVQKLKELIADKFQKDKTFRKDILEVLLSTKDSNITNFGDKTKIINEISNCLEVCAYKLEPTLTENEYNDKYNSENITNNFLEDPEIFENYLNAITSNNYYIFFEEVPIFASLGNVSITILYQLNGKDCSEIFEPNINILGNFIPNSAIWGKRKKALIYHQGSHFSHRDESLTRKTQMHSTHQENYSDGSIASHNDSEQSLVANENEKRATNSKDSSENLELSPLSQALKFDSDLKWKYFRELLLNTDNKEKRNANDLDTEVYPSPSILVELSEKVYISNKGKSDVRYEKDLDLPPEWKLLTTAANTKNGYFGAAFWNSKFRQLVVAHQGTNSFSFKDICTDIYGIVLDGYADQMNSAVTFADHVIRITENVLGSDWQLVFTGHSLGGWLAQVTCFSAEFLRRNGDHFIKTKESGIHAHCVAFDSPGCDAMLRKLTKDFDRRYDRVISPDELDISTYLSAPNRVNTYNLHVGTLYRIFPDTSNLSWLQKQTMFYTPALHSIRRISETFVERKGNTRKTKEMEILKVRDWPLTGKGLLKREEEYTRFFEWANHLNGYHPPVWEKEFPIDNHTLLRYETIKVNEKCCSLSVFSSNEFLLLEGWATLTGGNIILRKIEEFTNRNGLGSYKDLLPKFTINTKQKYLHCEHSLKTLINRTKLLMRRFHITLPQAMKDQFTDTPSAVELIYRVESKTFIESITGYGKFSGKKMVNFKDCFGLHKFLSLSGKQIMNITSNDIYFDLVRIHNICEEYMKQNPLHTQAFEKKNNKNKNIIVLNWLQILNLKTYIESHKQLVSETNKSDLVIIAFPSQVELNVETELVLRDILSGYNEKYPKKLIFVTANQCALMAYIKCKKIADYTESFTVQSEPICFSDIDPDSQRRILEKPLLDLQGTHFNLSQLFNINIDNCGSFNRVQKILDSNLLKNLLVAETPQVKIQNNLTELHEKVTYVKIAKRIPIKNAAYSILNVKSVYRNVLERKPIVFFISTKVKDVYDAKAFSKHFEILREEDVETIETMWGTNIVVKPEDENMKSQFKELCHRYFRKRIYWMELNIDSVLWNIVYDSDFYVSRNLHDKFHIQSDVSKVILDESYSDLFIFFTSTREIMIDEFKSEDETKANNNESVEIIPQEQAAITKFEEMKNNDKPVHIIKVENIGEGTRKLIWVRSSGSIDNIRKYVVRSNDSTNEIKFTEKSKKMIIFTGEPGVGKSTTICSLSKQIKSTWVIQKELKNCQYITQLPSKLDIDGVVTFLLKDNPYVFDKMAGTLLKECLTHKSSLTVLLIFDGFDEIRIESTESETKSKLWNKNQEKFIQLFDYLKEETTANIWITSRTYLSKKLENKFSIIATEIQELNKDERKKFLSNIWTSRLSVVLDNFGQVEENLLEKYIDILFVKANSILGEDISGFMGVPLQMWMIAHVASPKEELFTNLGDSSELHSAIPLQIGNIYDLYHRFIQTKYDIFFHEKSDLPSVLEFTSKNILMESYNRKHRYSAFQLLFPDYSEAFLRSKILRFGEETIRNDEIELNRIGLIHSNLCGEFNFLHRTFAECFVAELFILWLEKDNGRHQKYPPLEELLLSKIFLCPDYKVIRLFMNNILSARRMTEDSLTFYARRIWTESYKQKKLFLNQINRTALHVISEENCEYIVELLLNISNPILVKDIVHESIDTFFFITSRDSFGHTALYLAGQQRHEEVISKFIEFVNNNSEFVRKKTLLSTLYGSAKDKNDPNINHLLERISENGNETVREVTGDIVKRWELITPLMEAVMQGDTKEVKKIVHGCPDSVTREYFVAVKDKFETSALHYAAEGGYEEISEYLIKQGAPLNAVDGKGFTPLHFAAMKGHIKIVRLLHSHGANISHKDADGMSAVARSATKGHLSVVEYLVDEGVDLHLPDVNGIDAVQHASKSGHLEVVELLIKLGANIHRVDRYGKTALSWAAFAGHLHVVKHLLSCGADAGLPDRRGYCATQVAINGNHLDVAEYLLDHGEDTTNNLLHYAIYRNMWKEAKKLTSSLPDGEGKSWSAPEMWVFRIQKARQRHLMRLLIEKGARFNRQLWNEEKY